MSFFKSKNFKKEKKTDKMFEVVDSTDKGKIVKTDLSALDDEKRLEFKKNAAKNRTGGEFIII